MSFFRKGACNSLHDKLFQIIFKNSTRTAKNPRKNIRRFDSVTGNASGINKLRLSTIVAFCENAIKSRFSV